MTVLDQPLVVEHHLATVSWVFPEITLIIGVCVLFLLAAFRISRIVSLSIACSAIVGAMIVAGLQVHPVTTKWIPSYSTIDPTGLAELFRWTALLAGLLLALMSWDDIKEYSGEYCGCLLTVVAGLSMVGRAHDLVTLFLALEMISIPTYILLSLPLQSKQSQESAIKYFMLSILSSAILLFGFSYLFGLAGSTNLAVIAATISQLNATHANSLLSMVAIVFVIAGLGFRMALVPFHFYAPDVYQGAPVSVVAQLAFIPKMAGFIALSRLLGLLNVNGSGLPYGIDTTLIPLTLWVIAVTTMCFGNVLALLQDHIKRIFAYSGIAHGGYMLIGVLVACAKPSANSDFQGLDVLFFYLTVYGITTIGALCVLASLQSSSSPVQTVDDIAGLGKSNPLAAAVLGVFFLSLIGMPLTSGFIGKFQLLFAAFEVSTDTKMRFLFRILAVIAVINSAISAIYYLRIVSVMYLRTALKPRESNWSSPALSVACVCAIATLLLGIWPRWLMDVILGLRD